ncbi:hypothetical protein AB0H29_14960 [Streptomyces thermolilacinus]
MTTDGRMQVLSVEAATARGGVFVVRCVGGVVRLGDVCLAEGLPEGSGTGLTVHRIERYRDVDVPCFDPPHAARVHLSGEGAALLARGVVLVRREDHSTRGGAHAS